MMVKTPHSADCFPSELMQFTLDNKQYKWIQKAVVLSVLQAQWNNGTLFTEYVDLLCSVCNTYSPADESQRSKQVN